VLWIFAGENASLPTVLQITGDEQYLNDRFKLSANLEHIMCIYSESKTETAKAGRRLSDQEVQKGVSWYWKQRRLEPTRKDKHMKEFTKGYLEHWCRDTGVKGGATVNGLKKFTNFIQIK